MLILICIMSKIIASVLTSILGDQGKINYQNYRKIVFKRGNEEK